jgi:hypothetical protein
MRIQIDGITLDFEKQTSPNHALLSELLHVACHVLTRPPSNDVIGRATEPKQNGAAAPASA